MTTAYLLEELLRFAYALSLKAGGKLALAIAPIAVVIALLILAAAFGRTSPWRRPRMAAWPSPRREHPAAGADATAGVASLEATWRASG